MNIDKYFVSVDKIPSDLYVEGEGVYVDEDGCHHQDAIEFIIERIFGFCGCGCPYDVAEYIRQALQSIYDIEQKVWTNKVTYNEWKNDNDNKKKKKIYSSQGAEYFIYYVLDQKGLTEHGGSVPGWLTESGKELLLDLNELKEKGIIGKE